jgi:septum formation protein
MLANQGVDLTDTLILAADTVVAQDSTILGKPTDRADAVRMLTSLSGRDHAVYSGIALIRGDQVAAASERTAVHVASLTEEQIARYVATGEPDDKAGSYAMQGLFSPYITGIEGCYFNVVGLPVHALFRLASEQFDIDLYSLR